MYVTPIATTEVDEVEYAFNFNDPGKPTESFGVRVTRRDEEATAEYSGIIIGGSCHSTFAEAEAVYNTLVSLAIHQRARRVGARA